MADQMALLYPKYPYRDELRITCWQLGKMHTYLRNRQQKLPFFGMYWKTFTVWSNIPATTNSKKVAINSLARRIKFKKQMDKRCNRSFLWQDVRVCICLISFKGFWTQRIGITCKKYHDVSCKSASHSYQHTSWRSAFHFLLTICLKKPLYAYPDITITNTKCAVEIFNAELKTTVLSFTIFVDTLFQIPNVRSTPKC